MTIFFIEETCIYFGRLCYLAILPLLPCVPRLLSSLSRPYSRDCRKELLRRIFTFLPRKPLSLEGQRGTGLGMIVKLLFATVCIPFYPWIECTGVCIGTMTDEDHATSLAQCSFFCGETLPLTVLGRNVRCTWSGESRRPPASLLFQGDSEIIDTWWRIFFWNCRNYLEITQAAMAKNAIVVTLANSWENAISVVASCTIGYCWQSLVIRLFSYSYMFYQPIMDIAYPCNKI